MKNWKKMLLITAAAVGIAAHAEGNWQSKVGEASQDPTVLAATMKGLSNAEQLSFYKAVNEAIAALPGSETEKAAKFVNAERAAIAASNDDNKTAMVAEIFATVTPAGLTAVNEDLAKTVLAKGDTPDSDYASVARGTLKAVKDRCAKADNAGARETFAILAFLRGSAGKPANLRKELLDKLDAETHELADNEWIDPALAGDYNPILGASNAEAAPELAAISPLLIPGVATAAILGDLRAETSTGVVLNAGGLGNGLFDGGNGMLEGQGDLGINAKPRYFIDKDSENGRRAIDPNEKRGKSGGGAYRPHPGPYQDQTTGYRD